MADDAQPNLYNNPPELPSLDPSANGPMVIPSAAQIQNISTPAEAQALANDLRAMAILPSTPYNVQSMLLALAMQADQKANELMVDDGVVALVTGNEFRPAFSRGFIDTMKSYLSKEESQYFNQLDERHQEQFLRLKYHTLTEEEKQALPQEDRKEAERLDKVKTALTSMEEQKTNEIKKAAESGEISEDTAEQKIAENKGRFKKARDAVERVETLRHDAGKEHAHGMEKAKKQAAEMMLPAAETQLRKTLKEDVIDDALLEKKAHARSVEKDKPVQVALAPDGHGLPEAVRKARESGAGISA